MLGVFGGDARLEYLDMAISLTARHLSYRSPNFGFKNLPTSQSGDHLLHRPSQLPTTCHRGQSQPHPEMDPVQAGFCLEFPKSFPSSHSFSWTHLASSAIAPRQALTFTRN
jgi:hypothetical protein